MTSHARNEIELDPEVKARLLRLAEGLGREPSEIVNEAVGHHLEHEEQLASAFPNRADFVAFVETGYRAIDEGDCLDGDDARAWLLEKRAALLERAKKRNAR